ncbi:glycerol-3-phosphate dehydrogenase [Roseomonas elaeocarpi]
MAAGTTSPVSPGGDGVLDLLVVGGGVNGVGIARDASGRGLSVTVVEAEDLAQFTSSSSSKLIHGGLRYLEYYEFRLVREALQERERLLRVAPHIIWPLRFVLPHENAVRPRWMVRLGLFLYDHLGKREMLPGSENVRFRNSDGTPDSPLGSALKPGIRRGFAYSDCWVEDSRLVVLNAMDARERGATIRTRTRFLDARREGGLWHATVEDRRSGAREVIRARALVNAAGPWVERVLKEGVGSATAKSVRLVKGSHIVVPRLYEGAQAYILQNDDRRIIFAIPYERDFTLIGTTDVPLEGAPGPVVISPEETEYLCRSVNRYFARQITAADVVWSYSGVRPLYDDAAANASAVTRDYVLDVEAPPEGDGFGPALLSIFGGKITTFRRLAEHALEKLAPHLRRVGREVGPAWTGTGVLPGGDMPGADFDRYLTGLRARFPFLGEALSRRLARAYGTRAERLLEGATTMADLGEDFGGGLTRAEVDYLRREEWAVSAQDILWRRSKLGLHVPEGTEARLAAYLAAQAGEPGRTGREEAAGTGAPGAAATPAILAARG